MPDIRRETFVAFARLHVLHHAAEGPVFGQGLMEELARHGYALGPGTLYPLLHRLTAAGLLTVEARVVEGRRRRYYTITPRGEAVLREIVPKLRELADELLPAR